MEGYENRETGHRDQLSKRRDSHYRTRPLEDLFAGRLAFEDAAFTLVRGAGCEASACRKGAPPSEPCHFFTRTLRLGTYSNAASN